MTFENQNPIDVTSERIETSKENINDTILRKNIFLLEKYHDQDLWTKIQETKQKMEQAESKEEAKETLNGFISFVKDIHTQTWTSLENFIGETWWTLSKMSDFISNGTTEGLGSIKEFVSNLKTPETIEEKINIELMSSLYLSGRVLDVDENWNIVVSFLRNWKSEIDNVTTAQLQPLLQNNPERVEVIIKTMRYLATKASYKWQLSVELKSYEWELSNSQYADLLMKANNWLTTDLTERSHYNVRVIKWFQNLINKMPKFKDNTFEIEGSSLSIWSVLKSSFANKEKGIGSNIDRLFSSETIQNPLVMWWGLMLILGYLFSDYKLGKLLLWIWAISTASWATETFDENWDGLLTLLGLWDSNKEKNSTLNDIHIPEYLKHSSDLELNNDEKKVASIVSGKNISDILDSFSFTDDRVDKDSEAKISEWARYIWSAKIMPSTYETLFDKNELKSIQKISRIIAERRKANGEDGDRINITKIAESLVNKAVTELFVWAWRGLIESGKIKAEDVSIDASIIDLDANELWKESVIDISKLASYIKENDIDSMTYSASWDNIGSEPIWAIVQVFTEKSTTFRQWVEKKREAILNWNIISSNIAWNIKEAMEGDIDPEHRVILWNINYAQALNMAWIKTWENDLLDIIKLNDKIKLWIESKKTDLISIRKQVSLITNAKDKIIWEEQINKEEALIEVYRKISSIIETMKNNVIILGMKREFELQKTLSNIDGMQWIKDLNFFEFLNKNMELILEEANKSGKALDEIKWKSADKHLENNSKQWIIAMSAIQQYDFKGAIRMIYNESNWEYTADQYNTLIENIDKIINYDK